MLLWLVLETAARLKDIADEGFLFVELMNHLLPEQTKVNPLLLRLANDLNLPVLKFPIPNSCIDFG